MKIRCRSIKKLTDEAMNEDAALAKNGLLVVSDGAGGGGIYANLWSQYLVANTPSSPLKSFDEFDLWIGDIWKPFYDDCEAKAKEKGGLVLKKFYDEGSFATFAAIWYSEDKAEWTTYGDSVAFCYNPISDILQYSQISLLDFARSPYLINSKDPLDSNGFLSGSFDITDDCWLFVASDAVSHFILASYFASHNEQYIEILKHAIVSDSRNAVLVENIVDSDMDFKKVINGLWRSCYRDYFLRKNLEKKRAASLIALDDYSLVFARPL